MIRRYLPKSTEELIVWYERYIAPVSLLVAFILDNVIFRAVNLGTTTIVLFLYLTCAVVGIFLLNFVETGRVHYPFVLRVSPFLPVVIQFAFGGIFSAFFVLYSQSATYILTWISVALLAVLLIGNERFRKLYRRFSFQAGILFVAILGFLIFLLPLLSKHIGPWIFIGSCALSVFAIAVYLRGASYFMPELVRANTKRIIRNTSAILLILNVLYFTNALPPLPLALKDAGVYHDVKRVGNEYTLFTEALPWYQKYNPFGKVFHRAPGEYLYAYTSIFAPSGLSTKILHEWQHYNEETEKWDTISRVEFPILGGRDGGYRGFSLTSSTLPGKWRVNVLTSYKQVIGRLVFSVENVDEPVELEEEIR